MTVFSGLAAIGVLEKKSQVKLRNILENGNKIFSVIRIRISKDGHRTVF